MKNDPFPLGVDFSNKSITEEQAKRLREKTLESMRQELAELRRQRTGNDDE